MSKLWQYYNDVDEIEVQKLQEKFDLNPLISKILVNRGVNHKNARLFLNPTRHDFHDPFGMPDMEIAVERLLTAIKNKEKTIIYGDYDVDGITSTTVLKSFLNERGLEVRYIYS